MKKYSLFIFFIKIFSNSIEQITCAPYFKTTPDEIKTLLVPISQGLSLYLQYHNQQNNILNENSFTELTTFYKYKQSINSQNIAARLFGQNIFDINSLNKDFSWNPEYFGLNDDAQLFSYINPVIQDQICNFELIFQHKSGLWTQIDIPIVYSIWQIKTNTYQGNLSEKSLQDHGKIYLTTDSIGNISGGSDQNNISQINSAEQMNILLNTIPGDQSFLIADQNNAQYVKTGENNLLIKSKIIDNNEIVMNESNGTIFKNNNDFISLTQNQLSPAKNLTNALNGFTYGNLKSYSFNKIPLYNERISNTSWSVANVLISFGYDKNIKEKHRCGLYAKVILPSGTNIDKEWNSYNFSPVIGNGNRWQLGGGISGFYDSYSNDQYQIIFHGDFYATYIFPTNQWRTYDKKNNKLSRYILVKEFDQNFQYTGNIFSIGDKNANFYNISNAIMTEGVIDCNIKYNFFDFDFGYTFIFQSKEEASFNCHSNSNEKQYFGYKGKTKNQNFVFVNIPADGTNWNSNQVSMFLENNNDIGIDNTIKRISSINETANKKNLFLLPEEINNSGLMNAQLLQKVFLKSFYNFEGKHQVKVGLFGAYGFSTKKYYTPESLEMGFELGLIF